jgi:hypothetical protein
MAAGNWKEQRGRGREEWVRKILEKETRRN